MALLVRGPVQLFPAELAVTLIHTLMGTWPRGLADPGRCSPWRPAQHELTVTVTSLPHGILPRTEQGLLEPRRPSGAPRDFWDASSSSGPHSCFQRPGTRAPPGLQLVSENISRKNELLNLERNGRVSVSMERFVVTAGGVL